MSFVGHFLVKNRICIRCVKVIKMCNYFRMNQLEIVSNLD